MAGTSWRLAPRRPPAPVVDAGLASASPCCCSGRRCATVTPWTGRTALLQAEQDRSERLLRNVLPAPIADRLKQGEEVIADGFPEVTVLFADLVDFTRRSHRSSPERVVRVLDDLFSALDRLAERHGLEKIKTVGDAYMVVGGLPEPRPDRFQRRGPIQVKGEGTLDTWFLVARAVSPAVPRGVSPPRTRSRTGR